MLGDRLPRAIGNCADSSVAVAGAEAKDSRTARRVESASAVNTASVPSGRPGIAAQLAAEDRGVEPAPPARQ